VPARAAGTHALLRDALCSRLRRLSVDPLVRLPPRPLPSARSQVQGRSFIFTYIVASFIYLDLIVHVKTVVEVQTALCILQQTHAVRCSCQIFSRFNVPKIIENRLIFDDVIQKIKNMDVCWNTVYKPTRRCHLHVT